MSKRKIPLGGPDEAGLSHNPFASLGRPAGHRDAGEREPGKKLGRTAVQEDGGGEVVESTVAARWLVRRERKGRGGKVVTLVEPTGAQAANALEAAAKGLATRLGTGARPKGGVIVVQGDLVERIGRELERLGGEVTLGN